MNPRRPPNKLLPHLNKPVIPYLTQGTEGRTAELASAGLLFVGGGELADLPKLLDELSRGPIVRVPVLLHVDLIEGLSNDEAGLRYVAATFKRVTGIVTVRQHLVQPARKLGLSTVVRLFLQDGRAVERGVQVMERTEPDAVELLPGVAFVEVADRFRDQPVPCIAGGLIRTPDLVRKILAAGGRSVSTTNADLWAMNRGGRGSAG